MTNGVKHVTINDNSTCNSQSGKQVNGKDDANTKAKEEEEKDNCKPGMKLGMKHLYSGKEDDNGRFQWQDKLPEDIGDPAENEETAKWALLVRNVKVYNDPRRVLSVHSIVVQSPLLRKLLARVLKNYPGVATDLNRLEFTDKFEPLIHRWGELQKAIGRLGMETEEERTTRAHAELLQNVLEKECKKHD